MEVFHRILPLPRLLSENVPEETIQHKEYPMLSEKIDRCLIHQADILQILLVNVFHAVNVLLLA